MNNNRKVFFDMEGVLVDVQKFMDITKHTSLDIRQTPGMYATIQPVPGSIQAVKTIMSLGFDVWIGIHTQGESTTPFIEKRAWVAKYLPELAERILMTPNKGLIGGEFDVLIDDRGCEDFKGMVIQFGKIYEWRDVLLQLKAIGPEPKKNNYSLKPEILTINGNMFNFIELDDVKLDIEEIAHALSHICRFSGHIKEFYSVAQHSVYVSQLVSGTEAMHGLLHDAMEAYIGDVTSPLKQMMPEYKRIEKAIQKKIFERFCYSNELPSSVAEADIAMLLAEHRDLSCTNGGIHESFAHFKQAPASIKVVPVSPVEAKKLFLNRYEELVIGISKQNSTWFMSDSHFKRLRFILGISSNVSSTNEWGSKNVCLAAEGTKDFQELMEMCALGLVQPGDRSGIYTKFHATESACAMLNLNKTQTDRAMAQITKKDNTNV